MAGPVLLEINHVEMIDDQGAEWSMTFEEVLGGAGRMTAIVQDRTNTWVPEAHWDVKATIRSTSHVLYRGKILTFKLILDLQVPWRKWQLTCTDYNPEMSQRKIGAFDGKEWVDTSGLGVFINVDPYGATLATDKLTVQALFDHYFRVDGEAIDTETFVNEYLADIFPIEWSYSDMQQALEEMAALIQANLQFWIDMDLRFHWVTIPAWQDLLQEGSGLALSGGSEGGDSVTALLFGESTVGESDLPFAPYNVVDVNSDAEAGTIGFSKLDFEFDGQEMPEQVYVKGGTGYVYNQQPDITSETKVTVKVPASGDVDHYELTFLTTTKLWHTDSTGYVSITYDTVGPSGPYTVKWVTVPWNTARNKGGNYWKLLTGPDAGKLVDDNTNYLSGYGSIRVQKVLETALPGDPIVGVGGSGWTNEVTQDPNKRQSYLDAPVSTTRSRRDSIGGTALYRGQTPTLRGSVEVYGLDGWRVGQAMKITDVRLPAELNNRYYVIQSVKAKLLPANDLRRYTLDFGDGPKSRWSAKMQPGDISWPPPFNLIEVHAYDLTPGPNSTQRIIASLVSPDGTPWKIAGKTVNWSFECYNNIGILQSGQGSIAPEVSVTDKYGKAYTMLTTGPGTGLVYYVFANVKAV